MNRFDYVFINGTPKDAFKAVKNGDEWQLIQEGDWIVQKESELIVVPNGLFKLFFKEKN